MARPKKPGLDYFPLDSDIFGDKDIRALMGRYGSDGFTLYTYILCEIYKGEGYYLQMDDDWEIFAAQDVGISRDAVKQVLTYLLGRSLLVKRTLNGLTCKSSTLAESAAIITSAGIQRRYQLAVAERARKTEVEVDGRIWILEKEETLPFIKVTGREGFSGNNEGFSRNNSGFSRNNDTKESKVKKSKGKESIYTPAASDVWIENPDVNAAFVRYIIFRAGGGSLQRSQVEALRDGILGMTADPAEQAAIIDQSTRAGWKNFYPLGSKEGRKSEKRLPFQNYEQRSYDYAALERQFQGVKEG